MTKKTENKNEKIASFASFAELNGLENIAQLTIEQEKALQAVEPPVTLESIEQSKALQALTGDFEKTDSLQSLIADKAFDYEQSAYEELVATIQAKNWKSLQNAKNADNEYFLWNTALYRENSDLVLLAIKKECYDTGKPLHKSRNRFTSLDVIQKFDRNGFSYQKGNFTLEYKKVKYTLEQLGKLIFDEKIKLGTIAKIIVDSQKAYEDTLKSIHGAEQSARNENRLQRLRVA